ncbi:MAG TPA: glutathione S-transferase, partial [Burkholderiaceae bacterium]|nr:glutathione S-transferase [Burkholderiaceae bacterium]
WSGIALDEFTHLKRWLAQVRTRPAVIRGLQHPPLKVKLDALSEENQQAADQFVAGARAILQTGRASQGA